jgi:hypothetical protein
MAGEMWSIDPVTGVEPDGTEWPVHAAIAKAVGGTVQPFDQYQGPYVLVGDEGRVGSRPYQWLVPGAIRLWVGYDSEVGLDCVYREDTDESIHYAFSKMEAIEAAKALLKQGE